MKKVNVAVLKENLSKYLHEVESGEEIVVTSHHRPVARVVAYDKSDLQIRKPTHKISDLLKIVGIAPAPGKSGEEMLREDRDRR